MAMKIKLGATYQDLITGFKGVAVGRCEYLTGCNQVLLVPKVKEDGSAGESSWYDEQRMTLCADKVVVLDNGKTPGCDKPAPAIR